jgi:hypothetical protein
MSYDPNYSNILASLTGANAGETQTGISAATAIAEQDWQYNSPYLQYQAMISSGPQGDNQLNIAGKIGSAEVKAGMIFSITEGVAVLGVDSKVANKPAKMSYVCIRGMDTRDSRLSGFVMGVPAVAGVEMVVTGFDTTAQYTADDLLYAEYVSSAFTGKVTNNTTNTKSFSATNTPIVGIVSPGFKNNSMEKVGDPTNVSGAGFMEVPFLRFFPIFDVVRGV